MTIIAKNVTDDELYFGSLEITIGANSQYDLEANFTTEEIHEAFDLISFVKNGAVVINDGSSDLSPNDALHIITKPETIDIHGMAVGPAPPDSTDLLDGFTWRHCDTGIVYYLDKCRESWLSASFTKEFGLEGNCRNKYLSLSGYNNPDGFWWLVRPLTICSLTYRVQCTKSDTTGQITPEINWAQFGDEYYFSGSNEWITGEELNLNTKLPQNERFHIYTSGNKAFKDVFVSIEFAWRWVS